MRMGGARAEPRPGGAMGGGWITAPEGWAEGESLGLFMPPCMSAFPRRTKGRQQHHWEGWRRGREAFGRRGPGGISRPGYP